MSEQEKQATEGTSQEEMLKNKQKQAEEEAKNQQGSKEEEEKAEQLTMTKAEYEKQLQAEADKRVAQAEKTFKNKYEKELKEKIEKERQDAERLAKLSSEERERELFERNKGLLEEKERVLRNREMKLAAIDVLSDEGLPVSFADQLLGESVDETHDRIQKFKKAWHDAVEDEVSKRLKDRVPESGGTKPKATDMNKIIREGFRRR